MVIWLMISLNELRDFESLGTVAYCTICNREVRPSTVALRPTVPSVTVG